MSACLPFFDDGGGGGGGSVVLRSRAGGAVFVCRGFPSRGRMRRRGRDE